MSWWRSLANWICLPPRHTTTDLQATLSAVKECITALNVQARPPGFFCTVEGEKGSCIGAICSLSRGLATQKKSMIALLNGLATKSENEG